MNDNRGDILLRLAHSAIATRFCLSGDFDPNESWLNESAATFVTLTLAGKLRGCIGTLEAYRPLERDVRENAVAAAFRDPRFMPLSREEFPNVRIEVSLLSPIEPIPFVDEADALRRLRPGVDGVVLEYGERHGTFLPQVWESLPDPADFLGHLKRKAALRPDFWHPDIRLSRYSVTKWKEEHHEPGHA
jgi:AmmeMemoRadiSam system protein A